MADIFDEEALYREIVKVWGEYGAHAEVFRDLRRRSSSSGAGDAAVETGWRPIETAPKDGTPFLAWFPKLRLDDDGDATDEVVGGDQAIVTCRDGQWDEPSWLDASGAYYFDDWCFAETPTLWQPLPPRPGSSPIKQEKPEALSEEQKDAARYRFLRDTPGLSLFFPYPVRFKPFDCPHEIEVRQIGTPDLNEAIDAAMEQKTE